MTELIKYDEKAMAQFQITPEAVAKMVKEYDPLSVKEGDTKSYKEVRAKLTMLVHTRTGVDKRRKELNQEDQEAIKKRNAAARMLLDPMAPLEIRFKTELNAEDDRKAKIKADKAAKEQARIDAIRGKINVLKNQAWEIQGKNAEDIRDAIEIVEISEITATVFEEFYQEATASKVKTLEDLNAALEVRIKIEEEETARKAEDARLEKIREEQEAEAKRLQDEKDKFEAEKRAEKERIDREEFKRKAKADAEREAKEKAERDEQKRIEGERVEAEEKERKEALKPDVEKLIDFSNDLLELPKRPMLNSVEADAILSDAITEIRKISAFIRQQAEDL